MRSKKCSNERAGELLHGFELQILTPQETENFELHLMECDSCREEVTAFFSSAEFIRTSPDSRKLVDIALKKQVRSDSRLRLLLSQLWPAGVNPILRPATLILVIFAVVGLQLLGQSNTTTHLQGIFQVDNLSSLSGSRSVQAGQTLKSSARNVLTLVFKDTWVDSIYSLKIVSHESQQTFYEDFNTRFNSSEATILLIEPNSIPTGTYEVKLYDSAGNSSWNSQIFRYK